MYVCVCMCVYVYIYIQAVQIYDFCFTEVITLSLFPGCYSHLPTCTGYKLQLYVMNFHSTVPFRCHYVQEEKCIISIVIQWSIPAANT